MMPRWKACLHTVRACRTPFVLCLDRSYEPFDVAVVTAKAREFPKWRYTPETRDCDDAAHSFRAFGGHGIGIAMNHRHAWNMALCHDGVWHIEPQNGTLTRGKWACMVIL